MSRVRLIGLFLSFGLIMSLPPAPVASAATRGPRELINVWTINIHLQTEQWRRVIGRMHDTEAYKPDIILVQEIKNVHCHPENPGADDKDDFLAELEAQFGEDYQAAHSIPLDQQQCGDGGSSNMVVWRTARLLKTAEARWKNHRYLDGVCRNDYAGEGGKQVGVRLRDLRRSTSTDSVLIMAASLHVKAKMDDDTPSALHCIDEDLAEADRRLEAMEANGEFRDLTIIGGDFNQRPDLGDEEASGQEANPSCWYRWLSAAHPNTCLDPYGGYGLLLDNYYDSVWVEQAGTNPSDALCTEWTHAREHATSGTACTDENRNGYRDRSRIDYLWFRWETAFGPRTFSSEEDQDMFDIATNDNWTVDDPWRYSDHRSVNALVRWCKPTETC